MDNKIFSAFQLTVLTISTLVYYIIKIMSINFLQPLSWLWFTPFKSLTMPLKRWMEMNVLERVQGCNRITAQGHREMEEQRTEEKQPESAAVRTGRRRERLHTAPWWRVKLVPPWESWGRGISWGNTSWSGGRFSAWKAQWLEGVGLSHGRISLLREEKINMCVEESPWGSLRAMEAFIFQVVLMAWGQHFYSTQERSLTLHYIVLFLGKWDKPAKGKSVKQSTRWSKKKKKNQSQKSLVLNFETWAPAVGPLLCDLSTCKLCLFPSSAFGSSVSQYSRCQVAIHHS